MSVLPVPPDGCGGCTDRDVVIAAQAPRIEAQAAEVRDLRERLERLERLVTSNSGTSSFPPSMDGQPGRKRPVPRPRPEGGAAKRRPGKQPGAPGTSLAWRDEPDERVAVRPAGRCGCGADLAGAAGLGTAASHQQIDIRSRYDFSVACIGGQFFEFRADRRKLAIHNVAEFFRRVLVERCT